MAVKMYKSLMGWAEWKPGDDKHLPTHRLLTEEEYQGLLDKIRQLEGQLRQEKYNGEQRVRREKENAQSAIWNAQAETAQMQKELEEIEAHLDYQRRLNENLLRISRERANADRNLSPKKDHSGYLVLTSREKSVSVDRGSWVPVWETTLQTPYTVDFTEEQAREETLAELTPETGKAVLERLGIEELCREPLAKLRYFRKDRLGNVAYDYRFAANYKSGYWEVSLCHTLPLGQVPRELMRR